MFQQFEIESRLITQLRDGDRAGAAQLLERTAPSFQGKYPVPFLTELSTALKTDDWTAVGASYAKGSFIGDDGDFLMVGPFSIRRQRQVITQLSGVAGKVDMDMHGDLCRIRDEVKSAAIDWPLGDKRLLSREVNVFPYTSQLRFGYIGGEDGEAVLVPDAWRMPHATNGPVLLDLAEQATRFRRQGHACVEQIFEPESAALLTNAVTGPRGDRVRAAEYVLHDVGHQTGMGLQQKLAGRFFGTLQDKSGEERRTYGITFFGAYILDRQNKVFDFKLDFHPGEVVASSFCTLFGVDAHRKGGLDVDVDAFAAGLIFADLFDANPLKSQPGEGCRLIEVDGKLAFTIPTYDGLLSLVSLRRNFALSQTISELWFARFPDQIGEVHALYQSLQLKPEIRAAYERLVLEPCKDLQIGLL